MGGLCGKEEAPAADEESKDNPVADDDQTWARTSEGNFSSGMDDLFADLASSMVTQIKSGPLKKLGGKSKDKWESRMFELTNTGLTWSASKDTQEIVSADILRVQAIPDVQGKPAFKVVTNVKKGKEYVLVAPSEEKRDEWVVVCKRVMGGAYTEEMGGKLLKLGGRNKDKFEERSFTANKNGLSWTAKVGEQAALSSTEIKLVKETVTDPKVGPVDFEVHSTVKDGKVYILRAPTVGARKEWIEAINELIGAAGQTFGQMGDNGSEEEAEAEPEKTEEELAEEQRLKEEARAQRKANMAAKRAEAKAKAEARAAEAAARDGDGGEDTDGDEV